MAETTGMHSKFYREGATAGTFEEIAKIASITPPGIESEEVEIPELDPPGGMTRTLVGASKATSVTLTLNFDPETTGHLTLEEDARDKKLTKYRIKLPNSYGWTFDGIVMKFQPSELSRGDVVQAEVEVSVSGTYELGEITEV